MIEKQLNKSESSNKFAKAVWHGNNQEFMMPTKEEQLTAEACKRLIENSIVCWNYMYLTKKICSLNSESEKQKLIKRI
ncbi:transposase, partial [bacterium]|nr:transposase [bacterium]